jgi:hypothetical protein
MALKDRLKLYEEVESYRGHPLIVYVTSIRENAIALISGDAVPELLRQLHLLPEATEALDLILVSVGGDGLVACQIVSVIRERVKKLAVLVPYMAFSAATLIALGADEIVMHPHGHLGPTDPQIRSKRGSQKEGSPPEIAFGAEDLVAFLRFAKTDVGLTDQAHLLEVFRQFCQDVGTVPVGVAARSVQLTQSLGEKLLQSHMNSESEKRKATSMVQQLNRQFFHHGYRLCRTEAQRIGLKVAKDDPRIQTLMWSIWTDLSEEMNTRKPFVPLSELDPTQLEALFQPVPYIQIPSNTPPQIAQQVWQNVLQQMVVVNVSAAQYSVLAAVMESTRYCSHFITSGKILASRTHDLQVKVAAAATDVGWRTVNP